LSLPAELELKLTVQVSVVPLVEHVSPLSVPADVLNESLGGLAPTPVTVAVQVDFTPVATVDVVQLIAVWVGFFGTVTVVVALPDLWSLSPL